MAQNCETCESLETQHSTKTDDILFINRPLMIIFIDIFNILMTIK